MKTLSNHPVTDAEKHYDDCLTAVQEHDTYDNEQALWLAEIALKRERKQTRLQEDRMLNEVNRHLASTQKPKPFTVSDNVIRVCLLLFSAGGLFVLYWLVTHSVVAR